MPDKCELCAGLGGWEWNRHAYQWEDAECPACGAPTACKKPWRPIPNSALVGAYLFAAVAANLVVAEFGQAALPWTAFVIIPFDLCSRDVLHDRWGGQPGLWARMAGLVGAGSALSFAANSGAWRISVASFVAFAVAGVVDALVYHATAGRSRLVRMNLSNLFSSITDSFVFPFIAFPHIAVALCVQQAVSKFVGGIIWSGVYQWARSSAREG